MIGPLNRRRRTPRIIPGHGVGSGRFIADASLPSRGETAPGLIGSDWEGENPGRHDPRNGRGGVGLGDQLLALLGS